MSRLLSSIRDLILMQKDVNKSVDLAEVYGAILWAVDKGIYDDPELEEILTARCMSVLSVGEIHSPLKDCIHLISEPYLIGGHTRLMEQLSIMHTEKPALLITRKSAERAIERTRGFFSESTLISAYTPIEKIAEIIQCLKPYKRVVLHIHPDDMVSVIACKILKTVSTTKIYFVNHADHVFTYGSSVADIYFELSTFGRRRDLKKTICGSKSFLGIPLTSKLLSKHHSLPNKNSTLNFFSAASPFKFKPVKDYDLRPAIRKVLAEFKHSTFWVVGANPLTNTWWWPIKLRYWNRFKVVSSLPYESYLALLERADFYVDSYPTPGGTAFAEQLFNGRRCVGLRAPIQGYSPADNLKRDSVEAFINSIFQGSNDRAVIASVLAVNGYEAVKSRYLACLYEDIMCANEMEKHVAWTGDISVYEQPGKITSAIPPEVVSRLIEFDKKFMRALFLELSATQKIKVALKLARLKISGLRFKESRTGKA